MRNLTYQQGQMITKGYWNDVIHDRLYFGDNDGGASVINATEFRIFIAEVGAATANISTGAAVTQTEADTSLEGQGGTIPNGEWFVINAIGINIRVSNWQATEPFTNNAVTSINVTPVARVTPIPLYDALIEQCTFELYRNTNDLLEKGNIGEYPCEFGVNGFAGGSGASVPALVAGAATFSASQAAYTVSPTVVINGEGNRFRDLAVFQELKSLDQFRGVFKVNRQINLASTLLCGRIDFYLVGRAMTNQEHTQFVQTMVSNSAVVI